MCRIINAALWRTSLAVWLSTFLHLPHHFPAQTAPSISHVVVHGKLEHGAYAANSDYYIGAL